MVIPSAFSLIFRIYEINKILILLKLFHFCYIYFIQFFSKNNVAHYFHLFRITTVFLYLKNKRVNICLRLNDVITLQKNEKIQLEASNYNLKQVDLIRTF